MLVIFILKNNKQGYKCELTYLYAGWIRQMRPERSLTLERCGTQYIAMVTQLLSSYCGAHLMESYCKESQHFLYKLAVISLFIIFDQNLVESMISLPG